jgi:hypothetical protein
MWLYLQSTPTGSTELDQERKDELLILGAEYTTKYVYTLIVRAAMNNGGSKKISNYPISLNEFIKRIMIKFIDSYLPENATNLKKNYTNFVERIINSIRRI